MPFIIKVFQYYCVSISQIMGLQIVGMLIEGRWCDDNQEIEQGSYKRANSIYAEDLDIEVSNELRRSPGRYHLIASMSCQWSQCTLIARLLKNLSSSIPVHIAHGRRIQGYSANGGNPWRVPGSQLSIKHLHELYAMSDCFYTGSVTVPVLWDSVKQTIISNDSAKIIRAFDAAPAVENSIEFTLVPKQILNAIEQINQAIYSNLSNGVYEVGFAQSQAAYDRAIEKVFNQLDQLESRLSTQRYLCGDVITEADIRLFSTLIRFDEVYFVLHRCCRRRLVDYPNLYAYTREIYSWPKISETVDFRAIREGSYQNDTMNNPYRIIAGSADIDWQLPHQRALLGPAYLMQPNGEKIEVDTATLLAKLPLQ